MSDLVVRAYNVGFGDAILVEIPDRDPKTGKETKRFLLIDVGNLLTEKWNENTVFTTVVDDITARTGGGPVDLYVLTHEHLDHAGGLLPASKAGHPLAARFAWLTGSADPDYYDDHEDARKKKAAMRIALTDALNLLAAAPDPELERTVQNNIGWIPGPLGATTDDHVDHLRTIAPKTYYVDRTTKLARKHPFREAKLTVLAPEEDTSFYYGRTSAPGTLTARNLAAAPAAGAVTGSSGLPVPPPGIDPGAYFDLVRSRTDGWRQNILEIDEASNNTSVVLQLEWRGWVLIFAGDAELKSWKTMSDRGALKPAHFIKVSHHGSHNGTLEDVFDQLFPPKRPDRRTRSALVSTHADDWASVPDQDTVGYYGAPRFDRLFDTRDVERGKFVEIRFAG